VADIEQLALNMHANGVVQVAPEDASWIDQAGAEIPLRVNSHNLFSFSGDSPLDYEAQRATREAVVAGLGSLMREGTPRHLYGVSQFVMPLASMVAHDTRQSLLWRPARNAQVVGPYSQGDTVGIVNGLGPTPKDIHEALRLEGTGLLSSGLYAIVGVPYSGDLAGFAPSAPVRSIIGLSALAEILAKRGRITPGQKDMLNRYQANFSRPGEPQAARRG
jgi:hypothetical protein